MDVNQNVTSKKKKEDEDKEKIAARPMTYGEIVTYLMSYIEMGESYEAIAEEHKRSVKQVRRAISQATKKYPEVIEYFTAKGFYRAKRAAKRKEEEQKKTRMGKR